MIDNFILSGNIPRQRALLHIYVKGDKIHGVLNLSILPMGVLGF
jgi:hypothetical protein